jgi:glucokinase
MQTIIGLDIGGTKTAVVEATLEGDALQRTSHPTEGARPFVDTFPALGRIVDATITTARAAGRQPVAISVVSPGPLRALEGVIVNPPNLPGWHNVRLKDVIAARFPGLPVYLDHDAKAGALAEFRFGAGCTRPGLLDMIFLVYGTGMGAGIIVHGKLLRGVSETAGEVATLRVPVPDDARVQVARGWEDVASGRGIAALARTMYPARWDLHTDIHSVVEAALARDPDALAVVAESGRWLGSGMATLVDVLNPQLIVVGSLAVVLGDLVLAPAREALSRYARPAAVAACQVVPAALGDRLSCVQAIMPALEQGGPGVGDRVTQA